MVYKPTYNWGAPSCRRWGDCHGVTCRLCPRGRWWNLDRRVHDCGWDLANCLLFILDLSGFGGCELANFHDMINTDRSPIQWYGLDFHLPCQLAMCYKKLSHRSVTLGLKLDWGIQWPLKHHSAWVHTETTNRVLIIDNSRWINPGSWRNIISIGLSRNWSRDFALAHSNQVLQDCCNAGVVIQMFSPLGWMQKFG